MSLPVYPVALECGEKTSATDSDHFFSPRLSPPGFDRNDEGSPARSGQGSTRTYAPVS
jgi:hypothetical protein